jgi:hypothetical protein
MQLEIISDLSRDAHLLRKKRRRRWGKEKVESGKSEKEKERRKSRLHTHKKCMVQRACVARFTKCVYFFGGREDTKTTRLKPLQEK